MRPRGRIRTPILVQKFPLSETGAPIPTAEYRPAAIMKKPRPPPPQPKGYRRIVLKPTTLPVNSSNGDNTVNVKIKANKTDLTDLVGKPIKEITIKAKSSTTKVNYILQYQHYQ